MSDFWINLIVLKENQKNGANYHILCKLMTQIITLIVFIVLCKHEKAKAYKEIVTPGLI